MNSHIYDDLFNREGGEGGESCRPVSPADMGKALSMTATVRDAD